MSSASAGAPESTVTIAVRAGGRSRGAVRWAAEHLVAGHPHHRVLLLHAIPAVSSIPSPSGDRIPFHQIEPDVAEMYVQDLKAKAQEVFLPFKKLCRTKKVETLVLDGENAAAAILSYVAESGTKNLVLGSSSLRWVRRILKGPDVPTTILKSAPTSCNVFVVSRRKLIMKVADESPENWNNVNMQIQTVSHKAFTHRERSSIFSRKTYSHSLRGHEMLRSLTVADDDTYSLSHEDGSASSQAGGSSESVFVLPRSRSHEDRNLDKRILEVQAWKNHNVISPFRDVPLVILQSAKEGEAPAEIERLRLELQNTLAMYNRACKDLVHAKRKVEVLSIECSEEAKKVKDAVEREELLRQAAAEEKAKHLEAIRQVQEARQLLAKEALDRHKAEIAATRLASEKSKVVDVLFLNNKRCRRYTRKEIEVATENFSDAKKIGEGGYGNVYKCNLDNTLVAIKVLRQDSSDKKEEFLREVEVLSQLHHPHMVLLLGVCPESGCLVYEYMENGSLDDQLFHREGAQPLPWFIRFRIIFEVACGLAFLHGNKPEPIVHRDLKPGNILLDKNYVSKIGDVGLAKIMSDVVPDGLTEYNETVLAGTLFYMDPEYHRTGTLRPKSDLYALGIIALQLLTARQPKGLLTDVENALKVGSFSNLLDKSISDWPLVEAEKLAKLAVKCAGLRCRDRPDLDSQVLPELEELLHMANVCFKLRQSNVYAPSHYLCPILQEVMDNPYVAADGFTYEHRAIKAWLQKHKISPVTKLRLPHTCIIPNHSLRSAIQEWKSRAAFETT